MPAQKGAPSIIGIVLAAGESSRAGQDKALLEWGGRTFLDRVVATLRAGGIERVCVVLGHHADQIRSAVDLSGMLVAINSEYRRGQTSSLQTGLRAVCGYEDTPSQASAPEPESGLPPPAPDAVILALVDHPAVTPSTVATLAAEFGKSRTPAVVPTYGDQRGHPVVIAQALFPELLQLSSNEGANRVLRRYRSRTRFVPVNDPGILIDVDDPRAYEVLKDRVR